MCENTNCLTSECYGHSMWCYHGVAMVRFYDDALTVNSVNYMKFCHLKI